MAKINLILCDDHPLILESLEKLIEAQPEMTVIGKANSAAALDALLPTLESGILLLDFSLPDGDGLELCKKWSKSFSIIGFTGVEDLTVIHYFLRNGAKGYLSKSATNQEIITAIQEVASGKDYLNPEVALALATSKPIHPNPHYIPKLSVREKQVLELIVAENTTQEIASKLFISVNTVETHRNHLLQKLGAKNLAGLVRIALEKGLV
jgi:DNA-binding NarL/FixJ family response regulator